MKKCKNCAHCIEKEFSPNNEGFYCKLAGMRVSGNKDHEMNCFKQNEEKKGQTTKTKAIGYAYKTSTIAIKLGFRSSGCYYVRLEEGAVDLTPALLKGFESLEDCRSFADSLREEYTVFCGKKLDGTQWE